MSLAEQLSNDMRVAMRAGETRRRDVIRFLRAAIANAAIARGRELTDEEILSLVRLQIKQRHESIEQFQKGNRTDLADEESAQIAVLETYLPAQMDDTELQSLVRRLAGDLRATGPRDMSALMPALQAAAGSRATGRRLSDAARAELAHRSAESSSI